MSFGPCEMLCMCNDGTRISRVTHTDWKRPLRVPDHPPGAAPPASFLSVPEVREGEASHSTSTHCSSEWSLSSTQGVGLGECVSVEEAVAGHPQLHSSRPPGVMAGGSGTQAISGSDMSLWGQEQTLAAGRGTPAEEGGLPLGAWAPPLTLLPEALASHGPSSP